MRLKTSLSAVSIAIIAIFLVSPASAQSRRKVIIDQDARGPATTDQQSMIVLLQSPNVDALGITIVSGDLLGSEFQVAANDQLEVTVTDDFGPLNGLAEGDFLLVEQIAVRLPPQKIY